MRKILPLGLVIVVILAGFLFLVIKNKKSTSSPSGTAEPPTLTLPLGERPFATLTPRKDGHELKLAVTNINEAETVEYELTYLAGDISRGVIGEVEIKGEKSFSRDLLLGSCSRNVCKYDEGISGGTLLLKFKGKAGKQKYETPFSLVKGSEAGKSLVSPDGNFQLEGKFDPKSFYVIHSTIGFPGMSDGKIIGGPYGVFTMGPTINKGTIKLRLAEVSQKFKVLGWDSKVSVWREYSKGFETDGEVVSVEIDQLTIFVVVSL